MRSSLISALVALLWLSTTTAENDPNTYSNPTFGVTVTKPVEWHFISAEQNMENLQRTKLKDEELQELLVKHSSAPLVAMAKYQEPYDDLNPSFKVNVKPLGTLPGDNPGQIMGLILPALEKAFDSFSLEDGPTDTLIAGLKASYIRVHYNLMVTDTTGYPTCSELWVVPKESFFFMIGVGSRQNEEAGTREEISAILGSISLSSDIE